MSLPPRSPLQDQRLLAEIQSLLGQRPDRKNRAVRWSEVTGLRNALIEAGGAGSLDADAGSGGPAAGGGGTGVDALVARLERAEREIDSAEAEAALARGGVQNVLARLEEGGNILRTGQIVTLPDGSESAGIEAFVWDDGVTGPGSAVLLHGDMVIAPGTMAAEKFVAGLGSNMLQNTRFYDGVTHWQSVTGPQTTFGVREAGLPYAHPSFRTLMLFQDGPDAGEASSIRFAQQADGGAPRIAGAPCEPGKWYGASAYLSAHRCAGRVQIVFFTAAGAPIPAATDVSADATSAGSSENPDLWPRLFVKGQAPPGAAYVSLWVSKSGTLAGGSNSYLFLWKPMVEKTHARAVTPAEYGSNETSFMTGDMIFSRTLMGRHLVTSEAVITGPAQIGTGIIGTAHIGNAQIRSAHIEDLTIGPNHVRVDGLTQMRATSIPATPAPATGETLAGSLSFLPYEAGTKLLISLEGTATSAMGTGTTPASYRCDVKLYLNGTRIGEASVGPAGGVGSGFTAATGPIDMNRLRLSAAGTNTIEVRVSNAGQINNCQLRVQEFKK